MFAILVCVLHQYDNLNGISAVQWKSGTSPFISLFLFYGK